MEFRLFEDKRHEVGTRLANRENRHVEKVTARSLELTTVRSGFGHTPEHALLAVASAKCRELGVRFADSVAVFS